MLRPYTPRGADQATARPPNLARQKKEQAIGLLFPFMQSLVEALRDRYPPATAGTMLTSSPALMTVFSPSRKLTSSPLT